MQRFLAVKLVMFETPESAVDAEQVVKMRACSFKKGVYVIVGEIKVSVFKKIEIRKGKV